MTLFILKLILVPMMIVIASMAGRYWGPAVAGWLTAFPAVVSAILLLLAVEHGPTFGAKAAEGALLAQISSVMFSVAYSHACIHWGWRRSLAVSTLVWALMTVVLRCLPLTLLTAVTAGFTVVVLARWCFPRVGQLRMETSATKVELIPRVIAGVALTMVVTGLANTIGPGWSGALAGVPVLLIVLSVFTHKTEGFAYVVTFLRSVVAGFYSVLCSLTVLALLLPHWGVARAFLSAILIALAVQWFTRQRQEA